MSISPDFNQASIASLRERMRGLRHKVFGQPTALALAIRQQFPTSHASYWRLIERRFTEVYCVPEAEAVRAVLSGYSSPSAAMNARVVKRRSYIGFKGERAQ
jgi:hypothetical protein